MRIVCTNCGKKFKPTVNQQRRLAWPSTQNENFVCSKKCQYERVAAAKRSDIPLPKIVAARIQVSRALRKGTLVRPETCSSCGVNPGVDKRGRSKIHGHHSDHAKALDIEWLCANCHRIVTPQPRGEKCGAAKLTAVKILKIRKAHAKGISGIELSNLYKVSRANISDIVRRKSWRHV